MADVDGVDIALFVLEAVPAEYVPDAMPCEAVAMADIEVVAQEYVHEMEVERSVVLRGLPVEVKFVKPEVVVLGQ